MKMSTNDKNTSKPIQEGYHKRGGVNPPPKKPKPNFTPPAQTIKKDKQSDS